LARLRDSWVLALDARNLSPKTIKIYTDAANELLRHLAATDGPDTPEGLTHSHIEGLLAAMRERGLSASTLSITYRSLQQWMTWLAAEEKLPNPMEGTSPPRVPDIPVPVVPDDALTALLRTCEGNDFVSRRDTAIIRMFHDPGGRLTKITRLGVDDVHLGRDANLARVLGKGRRHRDLFSPRRSERTGRSRPAPLYGGTAVWSHGKGPILSGRDGDRSARRSPR
jgi:site-specific recombinase XerC